MPPQLVFPERISLAQRPTPLQRLTFSLHAGPDVRLWCKRDDLTGSVLSGNKIRKLEYVMADAMRKGADTLITCGGLQSNHCRATALVAAMHDFECHLILRGESVAPADGNLLLSQLAGANIQTFPVQTYQRELTQLFSETASELKKRGRRPYCIPTGASDGVGIWGYVAAAQEMAEDFARHGIDNPLVVCAAGSGGTLAGLAAGLRVFAPQAEVLGVAVCDSAEYFQRRVSEDIAHAQSLFPDGELPSVEPVKVLEGYIGPGYALGYPEVFDVIASLAAADGLVLDPVYTGKAFYGMLAEHKKGNIKQKDIVFVHTGGVFGLFPYKNNF
ncbi:D-cysteine desulfhydrase family protein [Gilvimarinus sp. SDUM040013]|uniref:D-cysteine desulfhydrase family protein n=1 Tax=Gilvimarinus gilvus TaxID=3058038 RepID=A0ABU4RWW0_9GAMM|nr:D-cysteine desulfhydrase family protein [Gilvimarinus sp. SDUM040013]MDO3385735.1 D-cysteine desulfhydrase family protein [Gilvimarinus sp. SDUM040013]MDX6849375.1 D-cysteine desulfhydrase family protein [Gilvimarinus sp. SDUM040013]